MELSKEQQTEFEKTIEEVASIVGMERAICIPNNAIYGAGTLPDEEDNHTLYTIHQIPVITYIATRLPQHLSEVRDIFGEHHDCAEMLIYAESLDRDDLKTLSRDTLSKLRRYPMHYQTALYLYTVGGGTHDMYNVDTQLLTRDDPADILDIPVLDNQSLTIHNYLSTVTNMRDIVYKRYDKYVEDNQGL